VRESTFAERLYKHFLSDKVARRATGSTRSPRLRFSSFGFRMSGLGFYDIGFRVSVIGFRVSNTGFRVSDIGFRALNIGVWVSDFGCRIAGFGLRASGFGCCVQRSVSSDQVSVLWVPCFGFRVINQDSVRISVGPAYVPTVLPTVEWYRDTSLIRNRTLLKPGSRIMPRALWWPKGVCCFL